MVLTGRNASESFKISNQRQNLQAQVDKFQSLSLTFLKINPSRLSEGRGDTAEYVDLDLLDPEDEGGWLAVDVENFIGEEEPEVTSKKVVLHLPSNLISKEREEYNLQELGQIQI